MRLALYQLGSLEALMMVRVSPRLKGRSYGGGGDINTCGGGNGNYVEAGVY